MHGLEISVLFSGSSSTMSCVPANLMLGGNPAMDRHLIQGGVEILLVASCYRNGISSRLIGHLTLPCDGKVNKSKTKLVWEFICIKLFLKRYFKALARSECR